MRVEHREQIVIEDLAELDRVCYEVPEGEFIPLLTFDLYEAIPASTAPIDDALLSFESQWRREPLTVRHAETVLRSEPEDMLTGDLKLSALVAGKQYLPFVGAAMGRIKRSRILEAHAKHDGPLVYMNYWPATIRGCDPERDFCGFGGWRITEFGFVCTEEQAARIAVKNQQFREWKETQ